MTPYISIVLFSALTLVFVVLFAEGLARENWRVIFIVPLAFFFFLVLTSIQNTDNQEIARFSDCRAIVVKFKIEGDPRANGHQPQLLNAEGLECRFRKTYFGEFGKWIQQDDFHVRRN